MFCTDAPCGIRSTLPCFRVCRNSAYSHASHTYCRGHSSLQSLTWIFVHPNLSVARTSCNQQGTIQTLADSGLVGGAGWTSLTSDWLVLQRVQAYLPLAPLSRSEYKCNLASHYFLWLLHRECCSQPCCCSLSFRFHHFWGLQGRANSIEGRKSRLWLKWSHPFTWSRSVSLQPQNPSAWGIRTLLITIHWEPINNKILSNRSHQSEDP